MVNATPRPLYPRERPPRERPGTHCKGGWVGPRAGLDGRKISPPRDSIPGPSYASIYNYIPETIHVSRVYSVTCTLYSQFVLHVMLFIVLQVLCIYSVAGALYLQFVLHIMLFIVLQVLCIYNVAGALYL